ncbi:hypothetical protein ILUMI_19762 [Ignelater luminosus]|uniref:Uncharacterized protein n=1 Tax=Ignelater luminosus TaxID=2038154 RepID=A0A8K0CHK9_IGNLU|nr:hypothetical protein ILUMI_19762 [Ignelater luminosus]
MVNSDEILASSITFNYFEPDHTFMSAGSFHHQVELSMKRKQISDFDDFSEAVGSACHGNQKLKTDSENGRPYLSNIVQVIAERGHFNLKHRNYFSEEIPKILEFLMKKKIIEKVVADIKKELQNSIILLEKENEDLRERSDALEQYSRRNNIRIFGVLEEAGEKVESLEDKMVKLLDDKLKIKVDKTSIDRIHRTGKNSNTGKPRPEKKMSPNDKKQTRNLLTPKSPSTAEDLDEHDDYEYVVPGSDLEQSTSSVSSPVASEPSTLKQRTPGIKRKQI